MEKEVVYLLGIPLVIWSLPVLFMAVLYVFLWPKKLAEERSFSPWARRILRWGNSVSWLCLGLAIIAWGLGEKPLAFLMALFGGLAYLLFVVVIGERGRRGGK